MFENIEKNMYLRRCQEKSHHYDAKKIQKILVFLLKSPYCDARRKLKKSVLKTSPRQNHPIMIPKKYR